MVIDKNYTCVGLYSTSERQEQEVQQPVQQGMFDNCGTAEEVCRKADHLADEVFLKQDSHTEAEEINKISIELIKTLNRFEQ